MPTAAEGFIILMIAVVVAAAARLPRLGDAVGGILRNLVRRDSAADESDSAE